MKPISLDIGKPVFQNIDTGIRTDTTVRWISMRMCLLIFLLVSVFDIVLTAGNTFYFESLLIGGLMAWNVLFSFVKFNNSKKLLIITLYGAVLLALATLIVANGINTGSYFYLFPAAVIFIINTNEIKEKEKFNSYFSYSLVMAAWISLFVVFSFAGLRVKMFEYLFTIRAVASILLLTLFVKYILAVSAKAAETVITNSNSDVLFHSNLEGYIVVDKDTQEIVDCNNFGRNLFELPRDMNLNGLFISQFMMRHLASDSINADTLMNRLPNNWHGEGSFTTHSKKEFNAAINCFNYIKDDRELQIIGVRDISELKRSESDLAFYKDKLEKSIQVKTRFLSSMSHELRTPLNGIIGSANLILAEQNLPDKVKAQTNLQLYSSEHMLSIINDILDFTKIESGKMQLNLQPFNLLEALHFLIKSVESQFSKNKVDLIYNFDDELADAVVISDVVKLRQILFNLISNALKFTFDGHVEVVANIKASGTERVSVFFSVKDTGIGIKKEKQSEIFNDFVQVHEENANRKFGGTGLGLTISEKLVQLFGGKIELESELSKGTCFYFTLDFEREIKKEVATKTELTVEEETYSAPKDIRGVRILVVEDNEVNAAILTKFLTKWDIRIKEAGNGIQALELLKYHKFDIILMDLEMPEMNGYTSVKIIRETDKEIPVIAFTATLLENMESIIKENGFNDFILKPFKPSELKKKIEKYADHRKIEYA